MEAGGSAALRRLALGLWLLFYLGVAPCLVLWMAFAEVLVASGPRAEGGAAVCVYFTGASVVERPPVHGADAPCPLFRRGR